MPSPLETLQRRFVASAFGEADPDFVAGVAGGGRLSAAEAVDVYRGGYPARMSEALGETFEACWRMLGDEDFLAACAAYARAVPSRTHNLSDYGDRFPEFLLERLGDSAPFIADLARLEWIFKDLFHAPAHVPLTPQALAAASRPTSRLRLGSAVRLLSFGHRARALWRRDRSNDAPLSPADWKGAEFSVLYKSGGSEVFSRELSKAEHAALAGLTAGRPLADALAGAEGLDEGGATALFAFVAKAGLVEAVA